MKRRRLAFGNYVDWIMGALHWFFLLLLLFTTLVSSVSIAWSVGIKGNGGCFIYLYSAHEFSK